ncbi:NADP-dependent oxidoreductase [Microbacterium bovistercoris]|uniref:NADP-dependent oxidoreductase n=1 Tax=Microbacterium bovistercoris TaxID=2293570 RepID=A0A371NRP2_9MICO|nr:NADP-dependent oxidoreductase [Microbacterium bovistercoris]REJ04295.1 NADP-dependent oxidoreductase [Microbacterium bovistercoris]
MRSAKYFGAGAASEVISLIDVPVPAPGPGQVLIRVGAVGLNPVDVKIRAAAEDFGVIEYSDRPGWDVAGVVTEVGAGVSSWRPGDRVFALAGFPVAAQTLADYAVVGAADLASVPSDWSIAQAGAAPVVALTAWQALEAARVEPGQRVLVLGGAGGVGHLTVQLAKARGAEVIATAGPAKHELVRSWGADLVVDYRDEAALEEISRVDAVIVTVSDVTPPRQSIGDGTAVITITALSEEQRTLLADWGAAPVERILVHADGTQLAEIADIADDGGLTVHLDSEFPLERLADAQERVETGRVTGKVVVVVDSAVR